MIKYLGLLLALYIIILYVRWHRKNFKKKQKFDCNHPEPFCSDNYKGFCQSKVGCNFKTES